MYIRGSKGDKDFSLAKEIKKRKEGSETTMAKETYTSSLIFFFNLD